MKTPLSHLIILILLVLAACVSPASKPVTVTPLPTGAANPSPDSPQVVAASSAPEREQERATPSSASGEEASGELSPTGTAPTTPSGMPSPSPEPTATPPELRYQYIQQVLVSAGGDLMWSRLCQMGTVDWYSNRVCQDTRLPNGKYHPGDWSQPVVLSGREVGIGDGSFGSMSMFAYINGAGKQIMYQLLINLEGTTGWVRECEISLTDGERLCPQGFDGLPVWEDAHLDELLAELGEPGIGAVSGHIQPAELGGRVRQTFVSLDGKRYYTHLCELGPDGPRWDLCGEWIPGEFPVHYNPKVRKGYRTVGAFSDFYYTIQDPKKPQYDGLYIRQSFVGYDQLHGWTHACRISDLPPGRDHWDACVQSIGSGQTYDLANWIFTTNNDLRLMLPGSSNQFVSHLTGYGCLIFWTSRPLFEVPTDY